MNSEIPNLADTRSVFEILDGCLLRWSDPPAWQERLLEGVQSVTGGTVSQLQLMAPSSSPDVPEIVPLAWRKTPLPEHADYETCYLESLRGSAKPPMPMVDQALAPALAAGSMTFARPMLVPDEQWYTSEFYRTYVAPAGCDEFAISLRMAPQLGALIGLGVSKRPSTPPFDPRQLAMLGILAELVVPMVGTRLSLQHQVGKHGLTRRQRHTLELLLQGCSEKQVAAHLGLSPGTVHDYVVSLHRHFDVSSRGELLSYFVQRRPKDRDGDGRRA